MGKTIDFIIGYFKKNFFITDEEYSKLPHLEEDNIPQVSGALNSVKLDEPPTLEFKVIENGITTVTKYRVKNYPKYCLRSKSTLNFDKKTETWILGITIDNWIVHNLFGDDPINADDFVAWEDWMGEK